MRTALAIRHLLRWLVCIAVMGCLSGCSDKAAVSADKLTKAYVELADAIDAIDSNSAFVDSRANIEKLIASVRDRRNEMFKTFASMKDDRAAIENAMKEYGAQFDDAVSRIGKGVERIAEKVGPETAFRLAEMLGDVAHVSPNVAEAKAWGPWSQMSFSARIIRENGEWKLNSRGD